MTGVLVDVRGERKAERVMRDTWGHLDCEPGTYPGTIVFAEGAFGGQRFIVRADFGDEAGRGPWFYEQITDWLFEQDTDPETIYRFEGTYRRFKNGGCRFSGTIATVEIP